MTDTKDVKQEVAYLRLTELNGWEHEEWFRYYPVNPEDPREMDAWKALADRFTKWNALVAERRWAALKAKEAEGKTQPDIYAQFGYPRPPPTVCDTMLTEFLVDKTKTFTDAKVRELIDSTETDDDDHDDDRSDADERQQIRNENNLYRQGDAAYRPIFYRIGKSATYTGKHTIMDAISCRDVLAYAEKSDEDLHQLFYKGGPYTQ